MMRTRAPIIGSDMQTSQDRLPIQKSPQPGEIVLNCGHAQKFALLTTPDDLHNPTSWFEFFDPVTGEPGIEITSPEEEGGSIRARWLACCRHCFLKAGRRPDRVEVRSHFKYDPASD